MAVATDSLEKFAAEVGANDPVTAVGGRTQWHVGGAVDGRAREVRAPAGIVAHQPAEMIVRVRAATVVAELDAALAEHGQMVPLDPVVPARATVGGVLAVGHSGLRRLRYGPIRDTVLEVKYVSAEGRIVKGGGPVVKNVSGFDIPRLLVGSLGTLGLIAEVVLRVQPRPPAARWLRAESDPFAVHRRLYRPSSILWDGRTTWVLLEGHPADVDAEAAALGPGWQEVDGPPPLPGGARRSVPPATLGRGAPLGPFVAEIGVGTVHTDGPAEPAPVDPGVAALNRAVKERFDPAGRLNPGRTVP